MVKAASKLLGLAKRTHRFKHFKSTAKTKPLIEKSIRSNKALAKAVSTIFSKKGIALISGATLTGVASQQIADYIKSNSGCFLLDKSTGKIKCKVRELSCCNPDPVLDVSFCSIGAVDVCQGFDEQKENSCCRQCDCNSHPCDENETLECQRPTVGDALSYFSKNTVSGIFWAVLRWIPVWVYGVVAAIVCAIAGTILFKLRGVVFGDKLRG